MNFFLIKRSKHYLFFFCFYSLQLRHEFSICRIYIKSGSSRAFDRRPTDNYGIERKPPNNGLETSSRATLSRSQETSQSGGNQLVDLLVNATTLQSNSEMMVDGLTQPFWEWEQLNWS